MAYKIIYDTIWTDPKVRQLKHVEKLMFVYLITNPHTHYSGLYYLPRGIGMKETSIPSALYTKSMETLAKLNLIRQDTSSETIWVCNMAKYQARGSKLVKGIASHLETLHNSPLIHMFLEYYKDMQIPYRYPIDTLSLTQDTLSIPYRRGIIQEQDQEQKQNQDQEQNIIAPNDKISFDAESNKLIGIDKYLDKWIDAFPAVDVLADIKKMEAWLMAHPKNKKSDYLRFINSWLTRSQDRARIKDSLESPEIMAKRLAKEMEERICR